MPPGENGGVPGKHPVSFGPDLAAISRTGRLFPAAGPRIISRPRASVSQAAQGPASRARAAATGTDKES
jgi:hypothetical protein